MAAWSEMAPGRPSFLIACPNHEEEEEEEEEKEEEEAVIEDGDLNALLDLREIHHLPTNGPTDELTGVGAKDTCVSTKTPISSSSIQIIQLRMFDWLPG